MRSTVLVDIDHTVMDSAWRDPMIGGPWDEYHAASINDEPIESMVELLRSLSGSMFLVGLTARPEKWRQLTNQKLSRHGVPLDNLWMRPDNDFRPAPIMKVDLAKRMMGLGFPHDVAFVMDDRDDVCAAFRAEGVCVLQVHANMRAEG